MPTPAPRHRSRPTAADAPPEPAAICFGPRVAFSSLASEVGAKLPQRILIAKWGENAGRTSGAKLKVNEITAAALPRVMDRLGLDLVPLDFEHQSHRGHANYVPPPQLDVAGHGTIDVVHGEGIYFNVRGYTPIGEEKAVNYPDVSGVFIPDAHGNVLAVSSVALTLQGDIAGAHFSEAQAFSAWLALHAGQPAAAITMDETLMGQLRELLDLGDETSTKDISESLEEVLASRRKPVEPKADPKAARPDPEETPEAPAAPPVPTVPTTQPEKTMSKETTPAPAQGGTSVEEKLDKVLHLLTTQHSATQAASALAAHNAAADAVFASATQAGKVIPGALKRKSDAGQYVFAAADIEAILKELPADQVPTEHRTPETVLAGVSATASQSADDFVRVALGIDPDAWKKGGIPCSAGKPAPVAVVA